jgi:3'-5' exonuclease
MPNATIALDIETAGCEWDELAPEMQTYLRDRERDELKRDDVPNRLGLNPATGRVVAIGIWYVDEVRGLVLADGPEAEWTGFEERSQILRGPEPVLLREFWKLVRDAGTIVTFHGRGFDGPYLMIRSAIVGVEPTRNLVPYRYGVREHCDLMEILSFFGARPQYKFEFWCRQFGIASSKRDVQGADVGALVREGRILDVARYCLGDARATAELYTRLRPMIKTMDTR